MHSNRRGSALLLVLVLGSILLLGLAALVGTALSEHRNAERTYLTTAAFALAETGVDRATPTILADTFTADTSPWAQHGNIYTRTFTADAGSLGGRSGGYDVVVKRDGTRYTVSSRGWVRNAGVTTRGERAVEVVFERRTSAGTTNAFVGLVAVKSFQAGSHSDSTISPTQAGAAADSYISESNLAPSPQNRDNKDLVGTLSAENDALNLSNGKYFGTVATGSSQANPSPTVKTATNASPPYEVLAKIDDPEDKVANPVDYNPNLVRHDLELTIDPVIPPQAPEKDGWIHVLPKSAKENTQFRMNGKLADCNDAKQSSAQRSGSTVSLGITDKDKTYIAVTDLANIDRIDVTGEVVLVVVGQPINASNGNGLTINYRTPNSKLTLYCANNIGGVIKTTQQMPGASSPAANWEAKRLTIGMLPGNHGIDMDSFDPAGINAKATAAAKNPTDGGTLTMNFDDTTTFVGQINAPFSYAQLSASGQKGKMSDFCGALLAKDILVTGTNGFAYHFDQSANGGAVAGGAPTLARNSWRQLAANDTVFN
jgi:hypothetical protein